MPRKGFPPSLKLRRTREKGDGIPPSHKAMVGQVVTEENGAVAKMSIANSNKRGQRRERM